MRRQCRHQTCSDRPPALVRQAILLLRDRCRSRGAKAHHYAEETARKFTARFVCDLTAMVQLNARIPAADGPGICYGSAFLETDAGAARPDFLDDRSASGICNATTVIQPDDPQNRSRVVYRSGASEKSNFDASHLTRRSIG